MVVTNRPWQLVSDLSRLLAAALAAAAFSLVTTTIWSLADQMTFGRLLLLGLLSVAALAVWLTVAHELWRRPDDQADAAETRRANIATVLTLVTGLLVGYVVLFAIVLSVALLFIPTGFLESTLRHPADLEDYASLTWLICSISTLGGAVGSGFETDENVRRTIRRYRPDEWADAGRDAEQRSESDRATHAP
jgi:hypothetical protein